jgi:hypothetical protein
MPVSFFLYTAYSKFFEVKTEMLIPEAIAPFLVPGFLLNHRLPVSSAAVRPMPFDSQFSNRKIPAKFQQHEINVTVLTRIFVKRQPAFSFMRHCGKISRTYSLIKHIAT